MLLAYLWNKQVLQMRGHTEMAKRDEYTNKLLEDNNIQIIQQSPCSPEVNALDLGVWMSVQSHVEKIHRTRTRDPDALAATVHNAWDQLPPSTITKIFNRIPKVLQIILDTNGDNDLVETRRGIIRAGD